MLRLRTPNGHVLTLPPRRVSIGESAINEVPIAPGNGVAAVHFRLQPWVSGHFIEDAGSGLATLVNGKPVTWAPLKHGDIITAGELKLIFESEDGGPVPEFPPETTVPLNISAAMPPPPREEPARPPAWLPPEALLRPVPPLAQAAARKYASVKKHRPRRLLPRLLLLGAAAAAAWYFFHR